jgi:hypothetical protein
MPRLNITQLPLPNAPYRVHKDSGSDAGFETKQSCRREDLLRARHLRRAAKTFPDRIDAEAAEALAAKLQITGAGGDVHQSTACSLYMGLLRYRATGALSKLYATAPPLGRPTTFTIVPRTWEIHAGELHKVDPRKLLATLRTDLYAMGAQGAGWAIMYIHGEFDPIAECYRLHVHGLADPGMTRVIDRLRKLPRYRSSKGRRKAANAIYRPIRIRRAPMTDLPRPLSYVMQSYWPARAILIDDEDETQRGRNKQRIKEPHHSEVLLWLDRWRPQDLALLIGIGVTLRGLQPSR